MPGLLKNPFFEDFDPPKPGKSSLSLFARHRNRSGVVELVGREPWIIARVENGVTKVSPKEQKTSKFPQIKYILDQKQQFLVHSR